MFQPTLITSVVVWERIHAIEEEKRISTRFEDVLAPIPVLPKKVLSVEPGHIFVDVSKLAQPGKVEFRTPCPEPCREAQIG